MITGAGIAGPWLDHSQKHVRRGHRDHLWKLAKGMTETILVGIDGVLALLLLGAAIACWRMYQQMSRANFELQRASQSLFLAENVGGVGTWVVDAKKQRVHWSDHVFKIHGRNIEQGEPSLVDAISYYHPKDRDRVAAAISRAFSERSGFDFKATLLAEDGAQKAVIARAAVQMNEAGDVARIFGVFIEETHVIQIDRFENDNFKIAL